MIPRYSFLESGPPFTLISSTALSIDEWFAGIISAWLNETVTRPDDAIDLILTRRGLAEGFGKGVYICSIGAFIMGGGSADTIILKEYVEDLGLGLSSFITILTG